MAAVSRVDSVFYINDGNGNVPGESIIFVNGIGNREEEARQSAESISTSIESQRVVLFYNPTFCTSHRDITVGSDKIAPLFTLLAETIGAEHTRCTRSLAEGGRDIRVLVIAHSHGALLTYEALNRYIPRETQANVEVATVGGAKLIPNWLARKAQNFINDCDLVSMLAQIKPKEGNSLIDLGVKAGEKFFSIKSDEDQSDRIKSSLATHEKIKEGAHPLFAKAYTLLEKMGEIIDESSKLSEKERLERACIGSIRAFFLEFYYHVEILTPRSSTPLPHGFEHYIGKVVEVIQARSPSGGGGHGA